MDTSEKAMWSAMSGTNSSIAYGANGDFPSPWRDLSSRYVPRTMRDALTLCEFLYTNYGIYRKASERIVDYFLTRPIFSGQAGDEQDKFEKILSNDFGVMERLREVGNDYMCFHGDTKVVTQHGIFSIRDLAGQKVSVLSQGGVYREADFKRYGRQELMEVEFSDGRVLLATPEHQWVAKNCSGKDVRVSTTDLRKGYRIERTVAARPEKTPEFYEAVRHGFSFGDGTLYNDGRQCVAHFFEDKDAELLGYFAGHGGIPSDPDEVGKRSVFGLPPHYKRLPDNAASANYWYGFVCGFLAADGPADVYGCAVLTQEAAATLEAIASQLPRIGMACGPVRRQDRTTEFVRDDGRIDRYDGKIHYLTLLKRFMQADDFLLSKHRANFELNPASAKYGQYIGIEAVRSTGLVDEVYCCVEMETHTFVVENAILSGNCYGNSFISIHLPFRRVLRCGGGCKGEMNIELFKDFQFNLDDLSFHAHCIKCKRLTRHKFWDYPNRDPKKIHLIRWNPKNIRIKELFTGDREYWLEIPAEVQTNVRAGDPFTLQHVPLAFLAAIQKGQRFKFDPECFFHMRENTLAGLNLQGWGIPSVLSAFRNFFRLQVLYRYDEVLKMDYILPIRILSPANTQIPTGNQFMQIGLGQFMQNAANAVRRHRLDGADWNFFPLPVEYQSIGGEGAQLEQSTRDSILAEEDRLLNTRGIPPEIYRSSLSLQAAPVALRLFERGHTPLVMGFNRLIQWIANTISRYMTSGEYEVTVEPVTIADNIDDKAWRLQAAMSGMISKETGFGPLGIKPKIEITKVIEEQTEQAEAQQKAQQDQQMKQMTLDSGNPGGEGQQSGQGGGMTPGDIQGQAREIAAQLMGQPDSVRRQQLNALRQTNDTLHAQVIKYMDQMRNQAGTLGQSAGLQQMGIAKSGFLEQSNTVQLLQMASAFFPPGGNRHHGLTYNDQLQKMALNLWWKDASWPILMAPQDFYRPALDVISEIADLLLNHKK